MALLRKKQSRKERILRIAADYLKLKAAGKAAKTAGTGVSKTAKGTAVAVRKSPKAKTAGIAGAVAGAGVLALVAAKLIRGGGEPSPA
jgi:hypothetical protein